MKFRTRLSLYFGGLLALSLATALYSIDRIARSSALTEIKRDLSSTVKTVEKLHQQRVVNLQQNLRLLAADYGFKAAYATRDEPTLRSALLNHQNRLSDTEVMMLCDLDGMVLANTHGSALNNADFPWPQILEQADEADSGEAAAFGQLDGQIYQFIVTPLLAPDVEAWVVSGFTLENRTAEQLANITGSEISFINGEKERSELIATSLDEAQADALLTFLLNKEINPELNHYLSGKEQFIGHYLKLNKLQPQITAFVQQSLDAALAPYNKVSTFVLWIFIGSITAVMLLIFSLSSTITRSLTRLSQAAQFIARGKLKTRVKVSGKDEFAFLSETFNDMSRGLQEKEQVRDLLGKVVSPEVASKLMREGVQLGGEEREVSVLFCDIRGFTGLSETRPPADVLNALNTFFSGASTIIEAHNGVVDKYIGDAVMALFGAPLTDQQHAQNAVQCGIELRGQADNLLTQLNSHGAGQCEFGIGIHSGLVVAGNIGSSTRLNYTVIGDVVNVASRVEGQTRTLSCPLIVTQATIDRCPDTRFTTLGEVQLKGRDQKTTLYTPE